MFVKKGDNVIMRSGSDKGKTGKVVAVFSDLNKVVVEGINIKKRHQRQRKANQKGQIIEKAMPVDASKVSLIGDGTKKFTRVGYKDIGGKKVRVSVKTGKEI